ncbi:MAG: hypothetical protein DSM107014_15240 [Gomphosphaeria aponina SAG 52.96 = DSM 107014]|uniref:CARDB domain-containing protein n=1 Tax=Gomphosphaeria aponina SAG 52.96 = DSM 107014 TaxID=1521640 RepID=A0A941JQM6_9CHRO|nr:hypothetical protein [Gomphosphaeria aponina SAG 52.96 = DSM 107014]
MAIQNDSFSSAIILEPPEGAVAGSNVGATGQTGEPAQAGEINSVWWKYTPTANTALRINTNGSDIDTYLSIFTGDGIGSLTTIIQDDDSGENSNSEVLFNAFAGTTYYIAVDSYSDAQGEIVLNYEVGPDNDFWADAIELTGTEGAVTGDNVFALSEEGELAQADPINSVWWKYTPTANTALRINTNGSDIDTYLSIFTGNSVNNLTTIIQDDDSGENSNSEVLFNAFAGTTYYIAVDSYNDAQGEIVLNYEVGPDNDFWADAIELTGTEGAVTGDNVFALSEEGELGQSGEINSVWWKYTPVKDTQLTVDTNGSNFDTYTSVFTGNGIGSLIPIVQTDNSEVIFEASAGTTYHISVDGYSDAQGEIVLNYQSSVEQPEIEPTDLASKFFNVIDEPLTAEDSFNVEYEIENQGGGVEKVTVSFYISTNYWISTNDQLLESFELDNLAANSSTGVQSINLNLPGEENSFWQGNQTYYIGMIVDSNNEIEESNEANNANRGEFIDYDRVDVSIGSGIDLTGNFFNVIEEPLNSGDSFNVDFGIENNSETDGGAFNVNFYISTNDWISTNDQYLGTVEFDNLTANGSTEIENINLTLPGGDDSFWEGSGAYYIGMVIDPNNSLEESFKDNNANRGEFIDFDKIEITLL